MMSTTSPSRFPKFANKDGLIASNHKGFGVRSGGDKSSRIIGPAVTSLGENKISPIARIANDSANEMDTFTHKETDYKT